MKVNVMISKANKALVFSSVPLWEAHLADTLEIVSSLCASGVDVIFLSCDGVLNSCAVNPYHKLSLCRLCRSTTQLVEANLSSLCEVKRLSFKNIMLDKNISDVELNSMDDLLNFRYKNMRVGALAASQLADDKRGVYFDFTDAKIKTRIQDLIFNGINLYEESLELIRKNKINEVYV